MPIQNPFFYGSPVEGERFTDREEQRSALATCMRNGQNAILLAPRRFGKTSLLGVAAAEARDAGSVSDWRELETTTNGMRTALLALRAEELVVEHRRPGTRGGGWQVLDSFFAHWIGRLLR